jgi:hypothetical protein
MLVSRPEEYTISLSMAVQREHESDVVRVAGLRRRACSMRFLQIPGAGHRRYYALLDTTAHDIRLEEGDRLKVNVRSTVEGNQGLERPSRRTIRICPESVPDGHGHTPLGSGDPGMARRGHRYSIPSVDITSVDNLVDVDAALESVEPFEVSSITLVTSDKPYRQEIARPTWLLLVYSQVDPIGQRLLRSPQGQYVRRLRWRVWARPSNSTQSRWKRSSCGSSACTNNSLSPISSSRSFPTTVCTTTVVRTRPLERLSQLFEDRPKPSTARPVFGQLGEPFIHTGDDQDRTLRGTVVVQTVVGKEQDEDMGDKERFAHTGGPAPPGRPKSRRNASIWSGLNSKVVPILAI